MAINRIKKLYFELRQRHGAPAGQWRLWCRRIKSIRDREEIIIGAVLTQNTNWRNVSKAVSNLKKVQACSLKKIWLLGKNRRDWLKLQRQIQPAGFYRIKTRYLVNVADFFVKNNGIAAIKHWKLQTLRKRLLELKGVGQETADSILNYALDKPTFVIDAYTKRLVKARRLAREFDYNHLQRLFQDNIKQNFRLYQDFHALIVIDGKVCQK